MLLYPKSFKALRSNTGTATPPSAKPKARSVGTPGSYAPAYGSEEVRFLFKYSQGSGRKAAFTLG